MSSSISRRSHEIHGNITTSTELEGAISKHTEIHGDDKIHKPSLSSFTFNSQGKIWICTISGSVQVPGTSNKVNEIFHLVS